jgi:hypothetical protein
VTSPRSGLNYSYRLTHIYYVSVVNRTVNDFERCCACHRRWLLAVALLAGGAGIGLGGALAALAAGASISPLVWVSLAGRLVATAGIVFAWLTLDTRPMIVRLARARIERLASARGRRRAGSLGERERASVAVAALARRRVRFLVGRLRSLRWQPSRWRPARSTGRVRSRATRFRWLPDHLSLGAGASFSGRDARRTRNRPGP